MRSYDLVAQHGVSDELVIVRGFGVVQDGGQFFQVRGAQVERYVGKGFTCQQAKSFGFYFEDLSSAAFDDRYVIFSQQAILGGVFAQRLWCLILEFSHLLVQIVVYSLILKISSHALPVGCPLRTRRNLIQRDIPKPPLQPLYPLSRSSVVPGAFTLAKLLKTIHPSIFPVRFFALHKLPHRGEKGVDLKEKDQSR